MATTASAVRPYARTLSALSRQLQHRAHLGYQPLHLREDFADLLARLAAPLALAQILLVGGIERGEPSSIASTPSPR